MTTALAIKCTDGIVLASDSQGSTIQNKSQVKKIFEIKDFLGLVGTGDRNQIMETKKEVENFLKREDNQNNLRDILSECLLKLHEERNIPYLETPNQIVENRFPFTTEILIGAKIEGDFRIYHGGFGEIVHYKARIPDLFEINEFYYTIGSGGHYASLVLKQQNRLFESLGNNLFQLPIEVNIGIACYVIGEVKNFDLYTGGETQISIINKNGYELISMEKQGECYDKMINNLIDSMDKNLSSQENIKTVLKKILPVSQTRPL